MWAVVKLHQDAPVFVASLDHGVEAEHHFGEDRAGYLNVISGTVALGDTDKLVTGDAVKAFGPEEVRIQAVEHAELILIDVPGQYEPVGVGSVRDRPPLPSASSGGRP
jgi:redox-sensitive bicupin YhaK (pirin superfamily)